MLAGPVTDLETRAQAAVDLALWDDRRAFDAVLLAAQDQELAECAGDEIGTSPAVFGNCGHSGEPAAGAVPEVVRDFLEQDRAQLSDQDR